MNTLDENKKNKGRSCGLGLTVVPLTRVGRRGVNHTDTPRGALQRVQLGRRTNQLTLLYGFGLVGLSRIFNNSWLKSRPKALPPPIDVVWFEFWIGRGCALKKMKRDGKNAGPLARCCVLFIFLFQGWMIVQWIQFEMSINYCGGRRQRTRDLWRSIRTFESE